MEKHSERPKLTREKRLAELQYWNTFSVRKWYEPLKAFTFPTSFVPMTVEDAKAFVNFQERLLSEFNITSAGSDPNAPFPPYDDPRLTKLEQALDDIIQVYVKRSGGAFVKMSDRSPKDATTERGRIFRFLGEPLKECAWKGSLNNTAVGLPAVYKAMMSALCVRSGREAMQLLLVSFRTFEDVQMRLDYAKELWDLDVVVREWVRFPLHLEFRGFVCKNNFTALSQYYYDCFFPEIVANSERIQRSIRNFWQTLKSSSPFESYVIDFAIMEPITANSEKSAVDLKVQMIELNPFDSYTDGALFLWQLHKTVLEEGPFTFRFVTEAEDIKKKTWWKKILTDYEQSQKTTETKVEM